MHESKLVNRREFTPSLRNGDPGRGGHQRYRVRLGQPDNTDADLFGHRDGSRRRESWALGYHPAQLTAADTISLDIQGTATHPHTVELTANEVQQIDDGARVSKDSSVGDFDAHRHTVTFN